MAAAETVPGAVVPLPPEALAGLVDIRGPQPTFESLAADTAIAIAIGIALAMLVGLMARRFVVPRTSPRARTLAALRAAAVLPPDVAAPVLARALADHVAATGGPAGSLADPAARAALDRFFATDWFSGSEAQRFAAALYRPDPGLDGGAIAERLARLIGERRS
ncbi:hypothetical protein C2U72_11320 [Prosthecomicrobium hirschii]|uniref:hypothetical protein n=1 Tax=Prosthecodimorpha hirschii TaxID=665126 RepID=UPI001129823E|nr:hypothetical protein [Prosthecomicrobium hirschii]TPQ50853.1 hypothetical protein C2U72_11320 [Prosthecomicrobium hirschii]